jgi:hypothetical protein
MSIIISYTFVHLNVIILMDAACQAELLRLLVVEMGTAVPELL